MKNEWVDCLNQAVGLTNGVSERNRFLTQLNAALYCTANDPQKRTILAMRESIVRAFDLWAQKDLDRANGVLLGISGGPLSKSAETKDMINYYLQPLIDFYLPLGKGISMPQTVAQYKVLIKEAVKSKGGDYLHNIRESLFAAEKANAEGTGTLKLSSPLFTIGFTTLSFQTGIRNTDRFRYDVIKENLEEAFMAVAGVYCKNFSDKKGQPKGNKVFYALTVVSSEPSTPANAITAWRLAHKHFRI